MNPNLIVGILVLVFLLSGIRVIFEYKRALKRLETEEQIVEALETV